MLSLGIERSILNLLYQYCELVDTGDFDGLGILFADAQVFMAGPDQPAVPGARVSEVMKSFVKLYDGIPRTRHVVTNTIIEVADDGLGAMSRSYFTVVQAVTEPKVMVTGKYLDRFQIHPTTNQWVFVERIMIVDSTGDLSQHLIQKFR